MSESNSNDLDAVNLTSGVPAESPKVATQEIDDDVDKLLEELDKPSEKKAKEQEPQPSMTEQNPNPNDPLAQVKTSTSRFLSSLGAMTTDLDSKLGISKKAKEINEKTKIGEKTKNAMTMVSEKVVEVDQNLKISETTGNVAKNVGQQIKTGVDATGRGIKGLDEKHNITSKTANFFSSSAEFINSKINQNGKGGGNNGAP